MLQALCHAVIHSNTLTRYKELPVDSLEAISHINELRHHLAENINSRINIMKFTLTILTTLLAVAMAAPSASNSDTDTLEKRCYGRGGRCSTFFLP